MALDQKFLKNSAGPSLDEDMIRLQKIPDFQEESESRVSEYFDVLLNNSSVTDETIMTLEVNGILLGNGCYCVLLAELEEALISSERGSNRFHVYDVLRRILQQEFAGTAVNYCRFSGGALVCLICFPRISEVCILQDSPMGAAISQKSVSVISRFQQESLASVNIFLSNFVKGVSNISKAYAIVKDMQKYASFWGLKQAVLSAMEDTASHQLMMDYPFFQQISNKLTNSFKLGKPVDVREYLDQTVEYIRSASPCRFQILITRILSFCNILIDKLLCGNVIDMKFIDANPFVVDMLQVSDEQELRDTLSQYAKQIERTVNRRRVITSSSRVQNAHAFIMENYADSSLSVALLAEHFEMTQPTLTRKFQQIYGLSPSDFIHHLRVDHVKVLLETTGLTLSQIAEQTGYASLSTMHRDFTKYEKLSPGRYRLLHRNGT